MSFRSRDLRDPRDYYLRRVLQAWAAKQAAPSEVRERLLEAAAREHATSPHALSTDESTASVLERALEMLLGLARIPTQYPIYVQLGEFDLVADLGRASIVAERHVLRVSRLRSLMPVLRSLSLT